MGHPYWSLFSVPLSPLQLSSHSVLPLLHAVLRCVCLLPQVATNSAQAAERDSRETEDCDTTKNVALATYKASQASIRSLEAAEAAAEAEKLTTEAANRALKAGTAAALNNAMATAQAFNEVSHNVTSLCRRTQCRGCVANMPLFRLEQHCLMQAVESLYLR